MNRLRPWLFHFVARRRLGRCDAVGARPVTRGAPRVQNGGTIRVGDDFRCDSSHAAVDLITRPGGELHIGDRVAVDGGAVLSAAARVEIGEGVHVGPWCVIADAALWSGGDGASGPETPVREAQEASPIRVEPGARLGERVIVLPGGVVGAGTVVVAGSVVDGVLPPRVVAAGVPARVIGRVRRGADGVEHLVDAEPADAAAAVEHGAELLR